MTACFPLGNVGFQQLISTVAVLRETAAADISPPCEKGSEVSSKEEEEEERRKEKKEREGHGGEAHTHQPQQLNQS